MAKGNATKAPPVPEKVANSTLSSLKQPSGNFVQYYLLTYNVLSTVGWTYILLTTLVHLTNFDGSQSSMLPARAKTATSTMSRLLTNLPFLKSSPALTSSAMESKFPAFLRPLYRHATTAYGRVGTQTKFVQSFAVLEVAHVLLGWVKSNLQTTLIQVGSRLYLVWGVMNSFQSVRYDAFFASMVLAWSATEVVRYSYYAGSLLGKEHRILTWLRYSTFYVLYPLGALSESALIYGTLPSGKVWKYSGVYDYVRLALCFSWLPGLAVMYLHMIGQRQKVLGEGGGGRMLKGSKAN